MNDDTVHDLAGVRVLVCAENGATLAREADVSAFLSAAWESDASWLALPSSRLGADFFRLRSGLAGAVAQKFVNYRIGLAILGDLSTELAASEALRDFVRETNRGSTIWFVNSLAELERRLATPTAAMATSTR